MSSPYPISSLFGALFFLVRHNPGATADHAALASALRSAQGPGELRIDIEPESLLINDVESTVTRLEQLKALGVRLAIDDFGTGYSSLAYLQRLSVDKLKIDQSFVRQALDGRHSTAIVRAIIDMARALELEVVAEGIETAAERDFLAGAKCAMGQGYLFARPMPADRFERFLQERAPRVAAAPADDLSLADSAD